MVSEQFHRDAEGRPLREGRTPAEYLREGEIEYRTCPYAGSRYQHACPMNVSALRQTSAHWDAVLDALGLLRIAYTEARGGYDAGVMDLWRVGQLGSALPWFYVLGRGEICPAFAAALSKATLGIGIWAQRVFVDAIARRELLPRFTARRMLETVEATDTLISDTEVCSASDKMLLRFFDVLTAERVAVTGAGEVGGLRAARHELMRFGAHYLAFKQWLWLYWLARRVLYRDLLHALGPGDDHHDLRTALADRMDPAGEPSDCFLLEPDDVPALPPAAREAWFRGLANLSFTPRPLAVDGSDAVLRSLALQLATVLGTAPPEAEALGAEAGATLRLGHEEAARAGRALATYVALDRLLGEVLVAVEAGLGGGDASAGADLRDRVIHLPPRTTFTRIAPVELGRAWSTR
jgi:hypothetical protein